MNPYRRDLLQSYGSSSADQPAPPLPGDTSAGVLDDDLCHVISRVFGLGRSDCGRGLVRPKT